MGGILGLFPKMSCCRLSVIRYANVSLIWISDIADAEWSIEYRMVQRHAEFVVSTVCLIDVNKIILPF